MVGRAAATGAPPNGVTNRSADVGTAVGVAGAAVAGAAVGAAVVGRSVGLATEPQPTDAAASQAASARGHPFVTAIARSQPRRFYRAAVRRRQERGRPVAAATGLRQHRRDVVVDRLGREHQPLGDLGVAQPLTEQRQHLGLARGQPGRVGARRWPRPARHGASSAARSSAANTPCRSPPAPGSRATPPPTA
jgi:hypothetical protein